MSQEQQISIGPARSIAPSAFIAPTAVVLGDVTVADEASVWFGAVVRGDSAPIVIGRRSNVQDGAILHVDHDAPCTIGEDVTIGHGAIVHGATIGDRVLVGIGAIVLNRATIGENSIIGAGAVITEGTAIPPNSLVLGVPGKVVRSVSPEQAERARRTAEHYVELARRYRKGG